MQQRTDGHKPLHTLAAIRINIHHAPPFVKARHVNDDGPESSSDGVDVDRSDESLCASISGSLLVAQRPNRIRRHRTPRRHQARERGDGRQHQWNTDERSEVTHFDFV